MVQHRLVLFLAADSSWAAVANQQLVAGVKLPHTQHRRRLHILQRPHATLGVGRRRKQPLGLSLAACHAAQTVALAVYRPFRFNGSGKDPKSSKYFVPDDITDTYTAFYSMDGGGQAPTLTLTVAP